LDNRPIGVFDSGLGGLTVVKQLKALLPNEDIVYFGDTGRVPYGTRSNETIIKYATQDVNFLQSFDVKMIIAACGTVSSVLPEEISKSFNIDYTGVLLPASQDACSKTKNKRIGVIGTSATINSGAYEKVIKSIIPDAEVFTNACPMFVPLVENGFIERDNKIAKLVAEDYLEMFKKENVDTLILGCTHFPIIKDIIGDVLGESVTLIDPGFSTAKIAKDILLKTNKLSENQSTSDINYFVSDTQSGFTKIASIFLGETVETSPKTVDLNN
jgi:glutamate racemase